MSTFIGKMNSIIFSAISILFLSFPSLSAEKLRFIGDVDFPTGEKFMETEIGGLSGLTFDAKAQKILAVSDDKGFVNETRLYEFDLKLDENTFVVKPNNVLKLKTADGSIYKKGIADFEGITFWGQDLLISSEGSVFGSLFQPPELLRFSRSGTVVENVAVPSKFIAAGITDIMSGTRGNKAFESLSTALDNKTVYLATEESLFQDGPVSTNTLSSTVRIVVYQNLKPSKEIAYRLEKVENDKSADPGPAENGLVDIAAIDDKTFYSMERSFLPIKNKNIIRIFKNTLSSATTDVSQMPSLKNGSYITVTKTLVLDLDEIIPLLKSSTKALDNIEGITFGPILKNGNRTLIVCSDNNFGKNQRTMFVAFEIIP